MCVFVTQWMILVSCLPTDVVIFVFLFVATLIINICCCCVSSCSFYPTSGWLGAEDDDSGVVQRIDNRIEDATGLTMTTAEQLQVVNYGIGGHYEPHYDFAQVCVCVCVWVCSAADNYF